MLPLCWCVSLRYFQIGDEIKYLSKYGCLLMILRDDAPQIRKAVAYIVLRASLLLITSCDAITGDHVDPSSGRTLRWKVSQQLSAQLSRQLDSSAPEPSSVFTARLRMEEQHQITLVSGIYVMCAIRKHARDRIGYFWRSSGIQWLLLKYFGWKRTLVALCVSDISALHVELDSIGSRDGLVILLFSALYC